MQAARDVHGNSGWFQRKGDFPNARDGERVLAPEAERFYRSGVPWLQRYLPFWLANLIDRMWLAMLSIVAVLLPLSRIVPPIVELRIRSRVFRWYAQLRQIESDVRNRPAQELLEGLVLLLTGVLLLTPGFVTDVIGFICLLPGVRRALARALGARGDVYAACCTSQASEPFYSPVIQERAWTSPIWYTPGN